MDWHTARRLVRDQYRKPQSFYDEFSVTDAEGLFLSASGKELFFRRWMPNTRKVKGVVFICHGYGGMCWYTGEGTASRIASAGYLVMGMDLQGHGCSEGLHCFVPCFDDLVADVVDFCDGIRGSPALRDIPLFLYGVSMGGAVAIKTHWMRPQGFQGAILNAPMVKISDNLIPPKAVITAMRWLCRVAPTLKMMPIRNVLDFVSRDPKIREEVKRNKVIFKGRPRLSTALTLFDTTNEICANMEQVALPILILHGREDRVTDPAFSEELHRRSKSEDKTLRMYDAWHALLAGESPELMASVYRDILTWLDERSPSDLVDLSNVSNDVLRPPFRESP